MEAQDPTKQWAVGLSNEEFTVQFQQRYPHAKGIVPDLNKWLKIKPKEETGITPFNEELIEGENFVNKSKPEKVEVEKEEVFEGECPGCGKKIIKETKQKYTVGMKAHQRHCKELLKEKE